MAPLHARHIQTNSTSRLPENNPNQPNSADIPHTGPPRALQLPARILPLLPKPSQEHTPLLATRPSPCPETNPAAINRLPQLTLCQPSTFIPTHTPDYNNLTHYSTTPIHVHAQPTHHQSTKPPLQLACNANHRISKPSQPLLPGLHSQSPQRHRLPITPPTARASSSNQHPHPSHTIPNRHPPPPSPRPYLTPS